MDRESAGVFLSGVRTGFGAFGGTLKDLSATDLGVAAAGAALARSGVAAEAVDHVVFGNVLQTSADAPAVGGACEALAPRSAYRRRRGLGDRRNQAHGNLVAPDRCVTRKIEQLPGCGYRPS